MADLEQGPLLATFEDGTKIYKNGYESSRGFVKAKIAVYSYSSEFNPNTGKWELGDSASFSTKVAPSSISFKPTKDGVVITGSVKYGLFDIGIIIDEDGDVIPVVGASIKVGDFSIGGGFILADEGDNNLSSYDTITVQPNGQTIKIQHFPSKTGGYVDVGYSIYDEKGNLINAGVTSIGDPKLAADMAAGIAPHGLQHCFTAGTLITLADGSVKPIEDIRHGDQILSHDADGQLVSAIVDKLFTNTTDAFICLSFTDGRDDLIATPGHHFLTETGDYMEIGHMARLGGGNVRLVDTDGGILSATAERLVYSAETEGLFEQSQMRIIAFSGNAGLKEEATEGWKTYNFEVRDNHTYIAGGVRVHNESVLDFLTPAELANLSNISVENGSVSDAVIKYKGSNTEIHATLVNKSGTQQTVREATFSDGKGNLIYQRSYEKADGTIIVEDPVDLNGQAIGGDFLKSLTPFLKPF